MVVAFTSILQVGKLALEQSTLVRKCGKLPIRENLVIT